MTSKALDRVLAEHEIRTLQAVYAHAVDRRDWDLLRTVFHPDATDEHGPYHGDVGGLVDFLAEEMAAVDDATHAIHQVHCTHHDADTISAETVATAVHRRRRRDGTIVDLTFAVRYLDRFERRDGRWAIADRVVAVDRTRIDEVVAGAHLADAFPS